MTPEREAEIREWLDCTIWTYANRIEVMLADAMDALDSKRERNAKLERVNRAAFDYMETGSQVESAEYRELLAALTAALLDDIP